MVAFEDEKELRIYDLPLASVWPRIVGLTAAVILAVYQFGMIIGRVRLGAKRH